VTNTERLTINTPGLYLIHVCSRWDTNATGKRLLRIQKNGATGVGTRLADHQWTPGAGDSVTQVTSVIAGLVATDFVLLEVYQNSGGNLDLTADSSLNWISAVWLSP